MFKKILYIVFLCISLILLSYLANKNFTGSVTKIDKNKLQISVSFYPLYFLANEITGDKAQIYTITPSTAEPHDYEPTILEFARISKSRIIILNGMNFEPWGAKLKEIIGESDISVVSASDALVNSDFTHNRELIKDPHIWLDPIFAAKIAVLIESAIEKSDPQNSEYYRTNLDNVIKKLDNLNIQYTQKLKACELREFITSHDAFGYLAKRYNLNEIAISGISPDEEPSAQKLTEISNLVNKQNIKIIFFEALVSPKLSETIANESGAKTMVLDPIEGLTDNNKQLGKDYIAIMQDNLDALSQALVCTK